MSFRIKYLTQKYRSCGGTWVEVSSVRTVKRRQMCLPPARILPNICV